MVDFRDNDIKLTFEENLFMGRPIINQPFIPTIEELRLGIVGYC
jgi:hypothetical protein